MRAVVVVLIAGCGRFGFDAVPDAATPASDSSVDAIAFADSLACEQDVVVTTVPRVDSLRWVDVGAQPVLVALHHVSNTDHRVHAYELTTGAALVADTLVWSTMDMFGPTFTNNADGLIVADALSATTHVITLAARFSGATDHPIANLGYGTRAYAEVGGARLIAGRDGGGQIQIVPLDTTLAPTTTPMTVAGGDAAYIVPAASGFVLAYEDSAGCEIIRISATGTVTAGPLTIPIACLNPMVAELSTGDIAYALATTGTPPVAYAGAANAALTSASMPAAIGAPDSFPETILSAGDHALVAVRTNGDSRIVSLASAGGTSALGNDFALNGTDIDSQTIAFIGGSLIHAHTESGNLVVRKLCR